MTSNPENRLFCYLDNLTPISREQQRLAALMALGLFDAEAIPVFDEATQTAARFLEAPICILSLMTQDKQWLKSTFGLSRVGLMNQLAKSRSLPRLESLCTYVVDSHQVLAIDDTSTHPVFATSLLVQQYGIRAYLGAPLLTTGGQCIGTLAIMDTTPRSFTTKECELLALIARWSLSEYERNQLGKNLSITTSDLSKSASNGQFSQRWEPDLSQGNQTIQLVSPASPPANNSINFIKVQLLTQLTQELRTPLTSVMGMASVLGREVYGPLTLKQKEYIEIIHTSGQHLVALVEEIVALGELDEKRQKLKLDAVDIEMLCQQAINGLLELAKQRQLQIRLSVEPGKRIWLLNKIVVRQMLYYLVFSVIQSAEAGGEIRIHISRKSDHLNVAVWITHPWLGDGLPQVELYSSVVALNSSEVAATNLCHLDINEPRPLSFSAVGEQRLSSSSLSTAFALAQSLNQTSEEMDRGSLRLLLSCQLAELHSGQISVQGSPELGYRYVVSLPQLVAED
jgi:signal transduction histidine kinase